MSAVCWSHLLPDPMDLRDYSTEQVEAMERTAECEGMTVSHGIAAIGELLAWTAHSGELDKDTATSIGWLINSLGTLSGRLADVANGAEDELQRRKANAPHPTAEG